MSEIVLRCIPLENDDYLDRVQVAEASSNNLSTKEKNATGATANQTNHISSRERKKKLLIPKGAKGAPAANYGQRGTSSSINRRGAAHGEAGARSIKSQRLPLATNGFRGNHRSTAVHKLYIHVARTKTKRTTSPISLHVLGSIQAWSPTKPSLCAVELS